MPLLIYNDGAQSIAAQLSILCSGAPINIAPTGAVNEFQVTYPAIHAPDKKPYPPIGHTMVYALANSSCRVEIWPLLWGKGLSLTGPEQG